MTLAPYSRGYRAAVLAALAVALVAIAWGGVVRATGSGMGCADDWPLCQGQLFPGDDAGMRIEWIHRALALLSGITVGAVALWTVVAHQARRRALVLAVASVPLFLLQALLGAVTVWLALPHEWVTLHFANAQLFVGALTALAVETTWPAIVRPGPASPAAAEPTSTAWTWLVITAAAGTYALQLSGALVRATGATAACRAWPFCDDALPLPMGGAPALHMAHRYVALAVGIAIVLAALAAWRRRRDLPGAGPLAFAVLALLVLQVAIGALNPLTGFSAAALAAHPAVASALWCAVVGLAVVAWRPPAGAGATVRDVVALTKPAIMALLLVTAVGAMFLAQRGVPPLGLLVGTVVGGALASGGASALNHYFDRDIDERMRRTRSRPLPAHRVAPAFAVAIGIAFNVAAFLVLAAVANVLAAILALAGTVFYIVVYTLWLKRTTTQNIVIGGAAGAVPPLVGWAAVTGTLGLEAWVLFAIVFFWTPAHFWALALLIRDDYERAGIPMLPVVKGEPATMRGILAYAASLVPLSAILFVTGASGPLYLVAAAGLGVVFVALAVRLLRAAAPRRRALARGVYLYSLLYLALLFVAISLDQLV